MDNIITGEIQGSVVSFPMPDIPCCVVKFKAVRSNSGNVYIGRSTVTLPDGISDKTTGYELDAGEETDWLPISNLKLLSLICDNVGDDLTFIALR